MWMDGRFYWCYHGFYWVLLVFPGVCRNFLHASSFSDVYWVVFFFLLGFTDCLGTGRWRRSGLGRWTRWGRPANCQPISIRPITDSVEYWKPAAAMIGHSIKLSTKKNATERHQTARHRLAEQIGHWAERVPVGCLRIESNLHSVAVPFFSAENLVETP